MKLTVSFVPMLNVVQLITELLALRSTVSRAPGPGGSLGKLHGARIARHSRTLIGQVIGPSIGAWEPGAKAEQWVRQILSSFQSSIAGGTDEIQHNILGEQALGLPREPAVDRDLPFRQVLRNA